jgi:glycerol kinase
VGYWKNTEDIENQWQLDRAFMPELPPGQVDELLKGWKRAVKAAISWAELE